MSFQYEEHRELRPFSSWTIIVLFCLAIAAWGLFNWLRIPDAPRQWDMPALRDVPGESVYSTAEPAAGAVVQQQITPLPEAQPLKAGKP